MLYLITFIIGVLICIMVELNGGLTSIYGVYTATLIIYSVSFLTSIILGLIKKEKLFNFKKLPIIFYSAGLFGVLTIIFNNVSVGKISMSAILSISLFGQALVSLFFDRFGFLRTEKRKFYPTSFIGLGIVLIGLVIMLYPFEFNKGAILAIILTFLTGISIISTRATCSVMSEECGPANSALMFSLGGIIGSTIALLIFGYINKEPIFTGSFPFTSKIYLLLGGVLTAVTTFLTNLIFKKIDVLYGTLLIFASQIFAGLVVDYINTKTFSWLLFIGAILSLAGLIINLVLDKRKRLKELVDK